MWWMSKAMIRCSDYFKRKGLEDECFIIMQVHDELVFELPYRKNKGNLPIIEDLRREMEKGGDDFGIPTPVGIDYHPTSWSESE